MLILLAASPSPPPVYHISGWCYPPTDRLHRRLTSQASHLLRLSPNQPNCYMIIYEFGDISLGHLCAFPSTWLAMSTRAVCAVCNDAVCGCSLPLRLLLIGAWVESVDLRDSDNLKSESDNLFGGARGLEGRGVQRDNETQAVRVFASLNIRAHPARVTSTNSPLTRI